jgi:hypothetical protein
MKVGRQCHDCQIAIHKKCEEKFNAETICTHEPSHTKLTQIPSPSDDDLKSLVNIEINNSDNNNNTPPIITTTTADDMDSISIKSNYEYVSMPNNNRTITTPTTAHRLTTKAAAAFSVLDSTARRSFRAFGHKHPNPPASLSPSLSSTSELSKSDESLNNPTIIPTTSTIKGPIPINPPAQTSSKLATAASSAYSKLREFKSKRLPVSTDLIPIKKTRSPSDSSNHLWYFVDLKLPIFSFSTQ